MNSLFLRGFSTSDSAQFVEILNIMFDVSRNPLVLRIRLDQKIVYIKMLCLRSHKTVLCKNSKVR